MYFVSSHTHSRVYHIIDQFTALMAVCANKTSKRDKLVNCARLVIDKGARVNSHDRSAIVAPRRV